MQTSLHFSECGSIIESRRGAGACMERYIVWAQEQWVVLLATLRSTRSGLLAWQPQSLLDLSSALLLLLGLAIMAWASARRQRDRALRALAAREADMRDIQAKYDGEVRWRMADKASRHESGLSEPGQHPALRPTPVS
jgi:hypothetical protein